MKLLRSNGSNLRTLPSLIDGKTGRRRPLECSMTQARLTPNVLQISATVRSSAELSIIPSVILMGRVPRMQTHHRIQWPTPAIGVGAIPSTIRHLSVGWLPTQTMFCGTPFGPTMPGRVRSRLTVSFIHRFRRPSKCLLQRSLEYLRHSDLKVFVNEGYDQCASIRGSEFGAEGLWAMPICKAPAGPSAKNLLERLRRGTSAPRLPWESCPKRYLRTLRTNG
jgi:hypothetical protein